MNKKIICVVGPSGSGKSRIVKELEPFGFIAIQSYTTREPRFPGETGHIFVTQKEFDKLRGDMVAYTKFDEKEYGATRKQIEDHDLYVIDPYGVKELAESIGRENMFVVHLNVSGLTCANRMKKDRTKEEVNRRLLHDRTAFYGFTDYNVSFRNETERDLEDIVQFIMDWIDFNSEK